MRRELEEDLASKIPFFKRDYDIKPYENGANIFESFGFECDNGWHSILLCLGKEILSLYERENRPLDIRINQVKEKFGGLRVYYSFFGDEPMVLAIDFLSDGITIRNYPNDDEFKMLIAEAIRRAERQSLSVCECCSKPGILRKDLRWKKTLCDDCYELRRPKN